MSEDILGLPPPATAERIEYGSAESQFGDLRLPAGDGPFPVAIVIHGGYWRAKYDLGYMGHLCVALAADGVATWNIEYRRVGEPGGGWPGTFEDVGRAAGFLAELSRLVPIDVDRVVTVGHSAGGHLALWLAGRRRIPPGSVVWSERAPGIRCAVSLAGLPDLRVAWSRGLSDGAAGLLMGGSPADARQRYAAGSPAELLPLGVPQTLIHGTADEDVPFDLSEIYHARATALGDDCRLILLEGAGHFEPVDPSSDEWLVVRRALLAAAGIDPHAVTGDP